MNIVLPPPADTDDDYVWFNTQAALMRRAVETGALPPGIDWPGIIEEIEDLGRSELHAVRSHLQVVMEHLIKLAGWPEHQASRQWTISVVKSLAQAQDRWSPGMAGKIDMAALHRRASTIVALEAPGYGARGTTTLRTPSLEVLLRWPIDAADIANLLSAHIQD